MRHLNRRNMVLSLAGLLGLGVSTSTLAVLASGRRLPFEVAKPAMPRVGYLAPGPRETNPAGIAAFRLGLRDFGYVEGTTISIEWRFAQAGTDQYLQPAAELARLPVDVLVAIGNGAVVAAHAATTTIPIIAVGTGDLVQLGLVASQSHPGGNVTGLPNGLSISNIPGKQLELLRSVIPGLARVAVLATREVPYSYGTTAAATALGVKLLSLSVTEAAEFESAFGQARAWNAQALMAWPEDRLINPSVSQLAVLALQNGLPSISWFKFFADFGFAMSYGPDQRGVYARAAYFVNRILQGTKPSELPLEEPNAYALAVNVRTLRGLAVTLPPDVAAQVTDWVP
jgi:putative ABC transport system substrate-binding protein